MKRQNHKVIVWLRVCVLAMFCPAFLWRCATVMNLEGGPIDTLPPVIVSMLPDNFTTTFTASKIYVTFDEFVQLKDQQKEFFTSPQMKKKPQLSIRGRGILIQIKDTLKENKTYALAGMNYTLRNLGDGFAMFDGAELIKDYVAEDYLVMSTYAMSFGGVDGEGLPHLTAANSPLADYPGYLLDYENPYGAGRITIL